MPTSLMTAKLPGSQPRVVCLEIWTPDGFLSCELPLWSSKPFSSRRCLSCGGFRAQNLTAKAIRGLGD